MQPPHNMFFSSSFFSFDLSLSICNAITIKLTDSGALPFSDFEKNCIGIRINELQTFSAYYIYVDPLRHRDRDEEKDKCVFYVIFGIPKKILEEYIFH